MNAPVDFLQDNVNRYRKLIKGEKVDYAPFRLWLDDTFVRDFTKIDMSNYANDFEVQFQAQKMVNDRFYDLRDFAVCADIIQIYYDYEQFRADRPNAHYAKFLEQSLDDFDKYVNTRPFDQIAGVRQLKEGIEYFNERLPKHKQVGHYLGCTGAMDLFSIFRGTEKFFIDLYDHSQRVKQIFEYITERSLAWMEYVQNNIAQTNGENVLFDKIDVGEDYCAYLQPDLFDEYVVPYTGKLFSHYKDKACCSLHTDGDMVPSGLPKLAETGIDELMGFSPNIDITEFRKALPDVILGGNLHPIKVMIEGSPETVKEAARYCFEAANQNQKFVLCTGGAITAGAKVENVDAFLEACYECVKY